MSAAVSASICMYRLLELGDCFLVTFTSGGSKSRMLIDCGSFRNTTASAARLDQITKAIAKQLAGAPLDVVVGTHQHNDHLSGFVHCEAAFRKIGIQQVWLSWLDDPADKRAQAIGKAHHNLMLQLHAAHAALRASTKGSRLRPTAARSLEVLEDILGFYGASATAPPEVPANAVKILKAIGARKPSYLKPGQTLDLPGVPAGSVRVHVLGPPRSDAELFRADPKKGESYDPALTAANHLASRFLDAAQKRQNSASDTDADYPFNARYRRSTDRSRSPALTALVKRYRGRAVDWRTIDDDWMQQAETLALYLDTFTNNSSLVLAIELVASRKVLFFAADAQTGNWSSWATVKWDEHGVNTDDLLARTVFYKVGHHASHNATLVAAFEKMGTPELVALIPVNKKDPNITKPNGWKMPAKKLFARLKEKTSNRVLQMDCVNPPECNPDAAPARAAWKKAGIKPRITDLSIELEIP
jgi:glyoxylase-like metal-dependent hydrolase (beta-lactamase superfamily II)